ncbi:class I SAM-dependent methyltransferase [Superficieibacter sp. 1612_C1]|uniref:methyltransferase domain-containing protein n=1 Tax=Superficieibacter sp. 1612_C1 TaxID=2780382 RepID=UPI0018835C58|nr:class I SAM-dependent methyltransferase [Superficieibacter sp. 1612_C1]
MRQAAKNILSLYQRHADAFASQRSCALFEKSWLDKFIATMEGAGHILDIGCGNGQPIAEYFIQQGFLLTGIDGAAAMLNRARSRFPDHCWREQGFTVIEMVKEDPHCAGHTIWLAKKG